MLLLEGVSIYIFIKIFSLTLKCNKANRSGINGEGRPHIYRWGREFILSKKDR